MTPPGRPVTIAVTDAMPRPTGEASVDLPAGSVTVRVSIDHRNPRGQSRIHRLIVCALRVAIDGDRDFLDAECAARLLRVRRRRSAASGEQQARGASSALNSAFRRPPRRSSRHWRGPVSSTCARHCRPARRRYPRSRYGSHGSTSPGRDHARWSLTSGRRGCVTELAAHRGAIIGHGPPHPTDTTLSSFTHGTRALLPVHRA